MIYFLIWGDKNTASSRLRVYNVLPYLDAQIGVPDEYKSGDVLIIQKKVALEEVERAHKAGAKVIYDIDDNYLEKKEYMEMCKAADVVTIGSAFFRKYFPEAPIIDDSLDWDGTIKTDYSQGKLIGWTGYGNMGYVFFMEPILKKLGYRFRTIVGGAYKEFYSECGFDAKTWTLETVDKDLSECDLCAYYLPPDDFSQAKGMNKLIKAWAIGIPCFVSPTTEYERVMQEAGVEGFLVTDWEHHDFTKPWEPKMREYALRFSAERIAEQWKAAISLLK